MSTSKKDIRMDTYIIGFFIAIAIMPGMYLGLLYLKCSQRYSITTTIIYYAAFLLGWNILVMN